MTFTNDQLEIMQEIVGYIKFKNLTIETKEDMDKAVNGWITSNFSYNYFTNEEFKENSIRAITKQLN